MNRKGGQFGYECPLVLAIVGSQPRDDRSIYGERIGDVEVPSGPDLAFSIARHQRWSVLCVLRFVCKSIHSICFNHEGLSFGKS